ncbi:P-loop containing nucleoside triphosphate hydrolase protein [Glomus cerebriforme]|uniref:P-loop containing nucleoside triphosphate hydrolase protein n=1 Tax=Glomus cerebriforme TaxID=658196 RepID=A0A397TF30_9GLOM|nr:P-loop containing nucleoside triphosphate hydrolase protein [Glomus cerebriforme]
MAPKSRPDRPFCACGKPVRLCCFVKKNHPRHRDRYWGCPERSCEHFEWVDPCPEKTISSQNVHSNSFTKKQNNILRSREGMSVPNQSGQKQCDPTSSSSRNTVSNSRATSTQAESIIEKLYSASLSNGEVGKNYIYPIKVMFCVDDDEHFIVRGYHHILLEYWKSLRGASYDKTKKGWIIPMSEYENTVKELKMCKKIPMEITEISVYVEKAVKFRAAKPRIEEHEIKEKIGSLWEALLPHQKEGVKEAIVRDGRVLLGDDMGLGKTIQALAIAEYYKNDGKVLVVCPASVAGNWEGEIKKWLGAKDKEIWLVKSGKEVNQDQARYTIVSYELAKRREGWVGRFQIVIADESHYLKDRLSERTKKLTPLMKKTKRAILLSGTPAESRPAELFAQINIVAPALFSSYDVYIKRFCGGEKKLSKDGKEYIDTKGAINTEELHWLLNSTVLIRRKKEDVNLGLPSKTRQIIYVEIPATSKRELKEMKTKAKDEKRCNFLKMYEESGRAKIPAIQDYLLSLKDDNKKYIVFGHHKDVIDQICYALRKEQSRFIRIDGQTDVKLRQDFVDKFQNEREIKFAVLSLTAASTGLNLQAADGVIFAELSWNPSTIAQGENRAHRIGRIGDVEIKYILSKDTLDLVQWQMLKRKSKVLGIIFDNEDNIPLDKINEEDYWMFETLGKEIANQCSNELNVQDINMKSITHPTVIALDDNKEIMEAQETTAKKADNNCDKDHVKSCTIFDKMADNLNWDFDIANPTLNDKKETMVANLVEVPTIFDMMADNLDWDFDKNLDLNFDTLANGGKVSMNANPIEDPGINIENDNNNIILNEGMVVDSMELFKDHSIITISDDDEKVENVAKDRELTLMSNTVIDSTVNINGVEFNGSSNKPYKYPAINIFGQNYKNELVSFFNQRYSAGPSSNETSTHQGVSNVLCFTNELVNGAFDSRRSLSGLQNKCNADVKDQEYDELCPRRNLLGSKNKRKVDVYIEEHHESDRGSKKIPLETNKEANTYVCPTRRRPALAAQVTDIQTVSQTNIVWESQIPKLEAQTLAPTINLPRTDHEDKQQNQEGRTKKCHRDRRGKSKCVTVDINRVPTLIFKVQSL